MNFSSELNRYCTALGCSNMELASACGFDPSTLSRYRSGARVPVDFRVILSLASGISQLATERDVYGATSEQEVVERLSRAAGLMTTPDLSFSLKLDELMDALSITNAEMARSTNVDTSYLSRIRRGQRNPNALVFYAELFASYLAHRLIVRGNSDGLPLRNGDLAALETALQQGDEQAATYALSTWLLRQDGMLEDSGAEHVLSYLDDFDFNAFIKNSQDDEVEFPDEPAVETLGRFYYGIEDMREAELDFLRTVATSPDVHEMTLCSTMPIFELGADRDFMRRYIHYLDALLKRGVHLNVIHDVTRPFKEMMMGLEAYIPLYMTGQISAYYLRNEPESLFCHLINASNVAMLEAECVRGSHNDGRYYFTTKPEEVSYGMRRAKHLLEHAAPLMRIYRVDEPVSFERFEREQRRRDSEGEGEVVCAEVFKNLRIVSYGDSLMVISKLNEPKIHFEIRHSALCNAIMQMELSRTRAGDGSNG